VGAGSRGGSAFTIKAGPAILLEEVEDLEKRKLRRLAAALSLASALAFWAVNAIAVGPRLAGPGTVQAFLKNAAIGVTFVVSLPAAGTAFMLVMERGIVLGRDPLPGVGRRTVIVPFALSLGVMALGATLSALAMQNWLGSERVAVLSQHAARLLPVGAGFALMGSFAGNLAGSVTLEAQDLGRWLRVNLVLLILHTAFWIFLMWAVLHMLWWQIDGLAP
jgi:hypothetical protein